MSSADKTVEVGEMEVGTVVEEKPVASNGEETKELTLEEFV